MRASKAAMAAILGIAVLLLLSGAGSVRATHGDLSGLYGGTLRVAVQGTLNLNPFTATDADSWKVIPLVYDSLARIDPVTLVPTPWAAESWSVSGNDITVTLRSGLAFHDGTGVTAADVVYSYNQYKNIGRVPSDTTVTSSGSTVTLSSATGAGLLYGYGLTLPIVKSGTASNPVGSGPWKLQSSTATSWTLVANAAHFMPPYLESVVFTKYANTPAAAQDLLGGNLDFIGWTLGVDEPSAIVNVGGVNKSLLADATIIQNPGFQHLVVGFNMASGKPTSDDDLRLALAKTLNPILYGQIYPSTVISRSPVIQEDVPWYNPNVPVYQVLINAFPRSTALLTESLQMLDQGGYVDRDGDGIREKPDGTSLSLTVVGIPVEEDARQFTIQEATVDVFTRLGLAATLVSVPSSQIETRLAAGNYDVFIHRLDSALDPAFLYDYVHSAGGANWFGFSDASVDADLVTANAAADFSARQAAVMSAQMKVMSRGFFVPVLHFNAIEATVRGAFEGWVNMPGGVNNFWTYQKVHVTPLGQLRADLTIVPGSLKSGQAATAIARVFDQDGVPVADASLTFRMDGAVIATGTTDASGTLDQPITAPDVSGATDIEVTVTASKLGYAGAEASAIMTVTPTIAPLSVSVSSSKVTAASGEEVTITVTVTSGGSPVAGAQVSLEVIGVGGRVAASLGTTNAQGTFQTTFSGDVGPRTQFRIVATASAAGYADGTGSTTVVVEQRVGSVEPRLTPGLDTSAIVAAIVALVVIGALAIFWGRKK